MGLVEDARRLADTDPIDGVCLFCGDDGEGDHTIDCPWLSLPMIVKVLELASALESAAETDPVYADGADSRCWFCERALRYVDGVTHDHDARCPWMMLMVALYTPSAAPARPDDQPAGG